MSARAFRLSLFGLAAAIVLAIPDFPGAIIGFCAGIAVAFFLAPASFALAAGLNRAGLPMTPQQAAVLVAGVGIVVVLTMAASAAFAWRRGRFDAARMLAFKALVLASLPLIAWLGAQAMVRSWP